MKKNRITYMLIILVLIVIGFATYSIYSYSNSPTNISTKGATISNGKNIELKKDAETSFIIKLSNSAKLNYSFSKTQGVTLEKPIKLNQKEYLFKFKTDSSEIVMGNINNMKSVVNAKAMSKSSALKYAERSRFGWDIPLTIKATHGSSTTKKKLMIYAVPTKKVMNEYISKVKSGEIKF